MYLKALEIQGFKSFADKTRLTFEKDITAIVGPNGSGKSNISDAILWVMGEQRTKALRGSKMEDVIFGGTEKRGKLGFAEVSLILDNSARIFDSDEPEIVITRRYYRSGDSEYYINREAVRLKDVNSLLMDTGLGRDGYSIIGQGRIAEIISSKSTDRREVFEEAAGISRYRYRKEEAEHKLEKTEENLLRINDKIDELELQVGPLKKQSEVAKKYLVLRDELRIKEISAWMETLDKIRSQNENIAAEYEQASHELEKVQAEVDALYASTESISDRMHRKDIETENARERLSAAEAAVSSSESAAAVISNTITNRHEQIERMLKDIDEQDVRVAELRNNIEQSNARIAVLDGELAELAESVSSNSNVIEGCRLKLKNRETMLDDLSAKATALEVERKSMESRIAMLTAMEKDYEGYSNAVRNIMRESARGTITGIHGPVANLIRADDECALAIETALGASAQNIVVDTRNTGKTAIELLKKRDGGRATFLPLDTIRGSVIRNAPVRDPGFVGIASELVTYDPRYTEIISNLLGRTVIAETLTDAIRMSRDSGDNLRIVTLDGQMIHAGGSMTGGSIQKGTGILSRANELEKLGKQLERTSAKENETAKQLDDARKSVASIRYSLDMALAEQTELTGRVSSTETEKRTTSYTIGQFNALLSALTGDSQGRRDAVTAAENEIKELEKKLELQNASTEALRGNVAEIKNEIAKLSDAKLELEAKRTKAEKDKQERHNRISNLEHTVARIEQKKLASELEEKQIIDRLWENYELSHTAANALRQPVENLAKINKEISELRRSISQLGTPNLGAIEEYRRVSERYNFLSEQRDDVMTAKTELLGIIRDITGEMEKIFRERFTLISDSFRTTFLELFGGGKAELRLEDESRILECGIEIKVQPPGKALSNINLLSGGEKAFVAIALYFAILKVSPTPFCVMDEIEAALDEANVSRFASYMRRLAEKTQFLVITHRRGTMEESDMLYGVTMQEKGVSSVLSLDVQQAIGSAEED